MYTILVVLLKHISNNPFHIFNKSIIFFIYTIVSFAGSDDSGYPGNLHSSS